MTNIGTLDLPVEGAARPAPITALSLRLQLALFAVLALGCLLPVLLNGEALVFPDTEGYLVAAQMFRPSHFRAFGYGAWLRVTGGLWSLWLPALFQGLLSAWLVTRVITLEAPRWRPRWRAPLAWGLVALVLLGHLPWLAAWIQPDLFTGLMILALWLLAEHWRDLPPWERWATLAFAVGACTMHLTHPPLLLGLALFSFAASLLPAARRVRVRIAPDGGQLWQPANQRLRRVGAMVLLVAALGWGMLASANWITYRLFTGSLGSSVFLFARLAADGDPAAALRPGCQAGATWQACAYLDRLHMPADDFLWRGWSPLPQMGFLDGFWTEAEQLNPILLRHDWPAWLVNSGARTLHQLANNELGDGMDSVGPWMIIQGLPRLGLDAMAESINSSLQAENGLQRFMPMRFATASAWAGLAVLMALVVYGLARRRPSLWWPALFFLATWLGNAMLIALGGEVHGRYSARLVWLAPLLAGLLLARLHHGRRVKLVS